MDVRSTKYAIALSAKYLLSYDSKAGGSHPIQQVLFLKANPEKGANWKECSLALFDYGYVLGFLNRPLLKTKSHCSFSGNSGLG